MTAAHVVVAGASAAGLATVEALRAKGFDGRVTLVGREWHLPYDRPPLSKQVLSGAWDPERVLLRRCLDADVLLGRTAVGLDVGARTVLLNDDRPLGYDTLVIATGVLARRLPGDDLTGVHTVRTLDDALSLNLALRGSPRVAVVGAGFLGCEVAAVARGMGLEVTLVGAPLQRVFGARVG